MAAHLSQLLKQSPVRLGQRLLSTSHVLKKEEKMKGKVAIISGGTMGIGLSTARLVGLQGANVVVSSRSQDNVDTAVAELEGLGISVMGLRSHAAKGEDRQELVAKTLERFGTIDFLVSNAAVNPQPSASPAILECPEDMWNYMLDVNLTSAFLLTKLVAPHKRKKKSGSIVYMSTFFAYMQRKEIAAYSVTKSGLLTLTKAVADELGPDNIRVNAVAPGTVRTKFSEVVFKFPEIASSITEGKSLKRLGKPDEIGKVVAFLLSDDASFITGETVVVAGGYPTRL